MANRHMTSFPKLFVPPFNCVSVMFRCSVVLQNTGRQSSSAFFH